MRVIQFEMLCFGRGVDVDVVTFMRWYSMMANKVHQIANDRCRSSVFGNIFQELRGYVIIRNKESFNYDVVVTISFLNDQQLFCNDYRTKKCLFSFYNFSKKI